MRKLQKKKILELISLIFQAHIEISNRVIDNDFNNSYLLLTQCQECAIKIGESIESTEKDNSYIINKLENYCEEIYKASNELDNIPKFIAKISKLNEDMKSI